VFFCFILVDRQDAYPTPCEEKPGLTKAEGNAQGDQGNRNGGGSEDSVAETDLGGDV
jgi:hypothetical protein